ncbi:MAG: rod-binding protein [Rhodospirillales bacterium]|nr:rod-binding protein [Rhodospirillales bacterium]
MMIGDNLPIPSLSQLPTTAVGRIGGLKAPLGADPEETRAKLQRSAEAFESLYITQMLKPMFEGLEAAEPFGAGLAEDVWRSFELEEFGKAIGRSGGIGLADAIYRQLLEIQERSGGNPHEPR